MKKNYFILLGLVFALLCGCNNGSTTNNNTDQPIVEPQEPVTTVEVLDTTEIVEEAEMVEIADTTTVRYLELLPVDYKEGDEFGLVLDYGGYAMDASAWPMPDGDWLITWHWCMAEDEGMVYYLDEDGNVSQFEYVDPFDGQPYPVIHKPDLSFSTRNYGGETINFYAAPDSDEILCSTEYKEISLDVIAADLKTRRLLVQTNPKDWCWGEPEDEWDAEFRHPFVDLKGWIDEEWVCGSTVTTCP